MIACLIASVFQLLTKGYAAPGNVAIVLHACWYASFGAASAIHFWNSMECGANVMLRQVKITLCAFAFKITALCAFSLARWNDALLLTLAMCALSAICVLVVVQSEIRVTEHRLAQAGI